MKPIAKVEKQKLLVRLALSAKSYQGSGYCRIQCYKILGDTQFDTEPPFTQNYYIHIHSKRL